MSVFDLQVGKGIVSFTPDNNGTPGTKRDLGNVTEMEITPEIEKLDHFSSRAGVRQKDYSVPLSQTLTVRMVLEEMTLENLAMALMGTVTAGKLSIFSKTEFRGELEFLGTNSIGPKQKVTLYNVSFTPSSGVQLISEEWNNFELTGEALVAATGTNAGEFGEVEDLDYVATP